MVEEERLRGGEGRKGRKIGGEGGGVEEDGKCGAKEQRVVRRRRGGVAVGERVVGVVVLGGEEKGKEERRG